MNSPLISIGVPTWSRPDDLRRCLGQLIVQSYAHLEIIVSDNCSADPRVREVLQEFAQRDGRVRYVVQPINIGPTQNFQFLLEQAQGEFFMWAGDDDHREPGYVAALHDAMRRSPASKLAFCDFIEVDPHGAVLNGRDHHRELKVFTRVFAPLRLLSFFFQREHLGKANLIYGLIRRDTLAGFNWPAFVQRHGGWGADVLFVFWLMTQGPLALAEGQFYKCTVGNAKWHGDGHRELPWHRRLMDRAVLVRQQVIYATQYMRIARGLQRGVLVLAWPVRLMDIFARLVVLAVVRWGLRSARGAVCGRR